MPIYQLQCNLRTKGTIETLTPVKVATGPEFKADKDAVMDAIPYGLIHA
jgi:hypothetical protein